MALTKIWNVENIIRPSSEVAYAVLLLNQGLKTSNISFVKNLWGKALVRVCVDGATNAYHHLMRRNEVIIDILKTGPNVSGYDICALPHFISGDFDSADPLLIEHYQKKGVLIIPTPDQDESDFTKSIFELKKYAIQNNILVDHVLTVADVGENRFDHVMGNLNTLMKVVSTSPGPVVLLTGSNSLMWILEAGFTHTIIIPAEIKQCSHSSWCGLIPLGHPATVTTTGLKWDLTDTILSFGSLVSTSNTYEDISSNGTTVTVQSSHSILWTMGLAAPEDSSAVVSDDSAMANC